MDTMLAARLDLTTGEFAVREVPVPVPGAGEVLVQVRAAGICLSDVHLIDGSLRAPSTAPTTVTLGHEVAGVVHAAGPDVDDGWRPGRRVVLQAGQSCGRCRLCRGGRSVCSNVQVRGCDYNGGWAQYAVARQDTLVAIPDSVAFDQAAIIPDAVSTPYAAVVVTAGVRPGQSVGIWGVGGLGVHGVRLARLAGAAPVVAVDPLAGARARAVAFGADLALDPADPDFAAAVRRATGGRGLDVAFDFAGVAAVRTQADASLGSGGVLVIVGLTGDSPTLADEVRSTRARHRVRGHFGSAPRHVEELVRLVGSGRLDLSPSVTDHYPLAEAATAVVRLRDKVGDPIRLILVP